MSDSVDRVFVHALATVRRLPRTGSSRPPPSARLRLYGLYKQSMEGDVSAILPRPSLPVTSPNPNDPNSTSVHRYASRDLRTRETQAEIEKWDAWHACAGITRTEAKRRYISILIETMKEYASGTTESRELVSELEFVWNQIKSQSGSDESEEGESPTRKLERAGLKRTDTTGESDSNIDPPGPGRGGGSTSPIAAGTAAAAAATTGAGSSLLGFARMNTSRSSFSKSKHDTSRSQSKSHAPSQNQRSKQKRPSIATNPSGLRVLSPMSQDSSDGIVENEELSQMEPEAEPDSSSSAAEEKQAEDEESEGDNEDGRQRSQYDEDDDVATAPKNTAAWRTQIESHLARLTLELTALREQLSSNSLLSRSSFSPTHQSVDLSLLPFRKRLVYQAAGWIRWAVQFIVRQLIIQVGLLSVVLLYGRYKGDRRVEEWVRRQVKQLRSKGIGDVVSWWARKYLRVL